MRRYWMYISGRIAGSLSLSSFDSCLTSVPMAEGQNTNQSEARIVERVFSSIHNLKLSHEPNLMKLLFTFVVYALANGHSVNYSFRHTP